MSAWEWRPTVGRSRAAIMPLAVVCLIAIAAGLSGQAVRRADTTLRGITVVPTRDGTAVVIEASGVLPQPSSGFANSPPRVYIDFDDVLPGAAVPPTIENPLVRRVRVAEHNASPLVTRVVVDLVKATTYRIDSSNRNQGRIVVLLGSVDSATLPPAQTPSFRQPPLATKPQPAPQAASGPSPPARGVAGGASPQTPAPTVPSRGPALENAYGVRVSAALVRLHTLRPLLESIDRQADPLQGNLDAAVGEFEAIGKLLAAIKAPRSRERTHALLQRTCTMGIRAVRIRQDGARTTDPTAPLNAASAAAGALMMLDRANQDLAKEK